MRTLILPDIHNKIYTADMIVDREKPDRVVCLGDYWDDYDDTHIGATRTAEWVKDKIERGWTMLLGNHDAAYLAHAFARYTDKTAFACPGYTRSKADAINKIIRRAHWSGMKLWDTVGKYVVSHAGFHKHFINPEQGLTEEWLRANHGKAFKESFCENNPWNVLTFRAQSRGGNDPYGGILWQDFDEFLPTAGVNQIFGHTEGAQPRYQMAYNSVNICIDTRLKHYIMVGDGGFATVKQTTPSNTDAGWFGSTK